MGKKKLSMQPATQYVAIYAREEKIICPFVHGEHGSETKWESESMGCLWREQDGERECVHHVSLYTFTFIVRWKSLQKQSLHRRAWEQSLWSIAEFCALIVISKSLGGDVVCCGSDSSVARSRQAFTLSSGFGWRGGADASMRKQPKNHDGNHGDQKT